jgi:WD40 repeat protein
LAFVYGIQVGINEDVCLVFLISSKFVDEFAEPVRILPPTHSVYVNKSEAETRPQNPLKQNLIALGHVWRADQSVIVTTNQDVLLLYSPLKNTCRLLSVSPMSKKSNRKLRRKEEGGEEEESESDSEELSDDEESEEDDVHDIEHIEAVVPVECVIYSKDLIIAGGRVSLALLFQDSRISVIRTDSRVPYIARQLQLRESPKINVETATGTSENTIRSLAFSPKYDSIIASFHDGRAFLFKVVGDAHSLIIGNDPSRVECIDASRLSESYVTGSNNGEVLVWVYMIICVLCGVGTRSYSGRVTSIRTTTFQCRDKSYHMYRCISVL